MVQTGARAQLSDGAGDGAVARRRLVHDRRRQMHWADDGRAEPRSGLPRPLVGSVVDSNGIEQFGITETVIARGGRGVSRVKLSVGVRASGAAGGYRARQFRW